MMRHHSTLVLGLAVVFVLPGTLPATQEPVDLEERLEATIAALEHLGGLERRIQAGHEDVLGELLGATEAPLADAAERDRQLMALRTEVSALQQRWDELCLSGSPLAPGRTPLPLPTDARPAAGRGHTGLDDAARRAIADQTTARTGAPGARVAPADDPLRSFETQEGFSADLQRQGRLLARAGRWAEALELLAAHAGDPETRFWMARCYKGLNRDAEAIELLQSLVTAGQPDALGGSEAPPEARALARRAGHDLAFLELRRQLSERRARRGDAQPAGSDR